MLNNSGESGHPCLVPDIRGNAFSFSPLRIMFAVGLLYMAFTMLRQNHHMTQQSHSQAYTLMKPKLKKTHIPKYSLQHYLQQLEKQPRCPLTDEWIKKLWYVYTMEYYSAIKRNTFESTVMRQMNLEPIIQSEVSEKEKDKCCILMHIYRLWKDGTEEFICRAAVEKNTQRTDLSAWGEVGRGGDIWRE